MLGCAEAPPTESQDSFRATRAEYLTTHNIEQLSAKFQNAGDRVFEDQSNARGSSSELLGHNWLSDGGADQCFLLVAEGRRRRFVLESPF